jgi:prolyl oligopeptidase
VTTSSRLGIFGGSNSGLLVGAAMTQRPELFGAVLCIAPLLDMVRYEAFDEAARWRQEYGTAEDPEDFQALYAYSPYHHVADCVNYPATMFVTGDNDDRCNPAHVRKMAALLQERPAQSSVVIVDYSAERGHSPVLPLSVRISALPRRIAFLCRELHITLPSEGLDEASSA